jgi:hypothetical protein
VVALVIVAIVVVVDVGHDAANGATGDREEGARRLGRALLLLMSRWCRDAIVVRVPSSTAGVPPQGCVN